VAVQDFSDLRQTTAHLKSQFHSNEFSFEQFDEFSFEQIK
jgi:hypothetical protein